MHQAANALPKSDPLERGQILLVDDIAANRAVVSRRLQMLGHEVTCVDNGRKALQIIAANPPDIVLLDYMMPEMNGLEVLRVIRSEEATLELPVIMVTARAESDATVEALEAGADDYVTKPIDYDVLNARIEGHLQRNRAKIGLKKANAALDEHATMRTMVLSDLEADLTKEIKRRTAVEEQLAHVTSQRSGEAASPPLPEDCVALLQQVETHFLSLCQQALEGESVNLAQMEHVRGLLEKSKSYW
ncbi:MAG: response regulator, partial [Pseudomonadota bacterium]